MAIRTNQVSPLCDHSKSPNVQKSTGNPRTHVSWEQMRSDPQNPTTFREKWYPLASAWVPSHRHHQSGQNCRRCSGYLSVFRHGKTISPKLRLLRTHASRKGVRISSRGVTLNGRGHQKQNFGCPRLPHPIKLSLKRRNISHTIR